MLRSVTTEHGNYRCLSIDGISETSPGVTELEMHDCTGRYNTGSGFWLRGIKNPEFLTAMATVMAIRA